uniref:NADH dehydrogenase subunit 6 n=1 Tax=Carausius morosus TaxID=7022 RepID=UPI0030031513|nr:NADH dehydrogenase subunit 6 [Carausius morosus]
MKMMMIMNMLMNITFMVTKHPLSMGVTIIMQTIIISVMMSMLYKSSWFAFILFLMYVGGMMVLFIYVTSLIPNMMFSFNMKNSMMVFMSITLMMILEKKYFMMNNDMSSININTSMLTKMYSMPFNMMVIMMASYLLLTMITVFKITEINKGPIRFMN